MVKPMEEILGEADKIVQACRQEMKKQGFDPTTITTKLDTRYIGIHSELRKMKTLLGNKTGGLTNDEEQLYYKLSDILCYSDKASREMRRSVNRRVEKLMYHWTTQIERLYAEKINTFRDKLFLPPIFNMPFQGSGLFVKYQLDEHGVCPRTYGLCRKFKTTIKRRTSEPGETMMAAIPPKFQVEMNCFIRAELDNDNFPHRFFLFDKNGKPVTSFHSSGKGKICLGDMEGSQFNNAFKGAVNSQRWDKVNEMFGEIEKLFMTAHRGGAYGSSYAYVRERRDALHRKIYKLWRYLRHEHGDSDEQEEITEEDE